MKVSAVTAAVVAAVRKVVVVADTADVDRRQSLYWDQKEEELWSDYSDDVVSALLKRHYHQHESKRELTATALSEHGQPRWTLPTCCASAYDEDY
jgi:hypothetical protein